MKNHVIGSRNTRRGVRRMRQCRKCEYVFLGYERPVLLRLKDADLELIECYCGFRMGIDSRYAKRLKFKCPKCQEKIIM